MTTATDPILEAILEERWHMASTAVEQFAGESKPSEVPSEDEIALIDAIRNMATRMVHEIGRNEEADLDALEFELLAEVEQHMLDFARRIETARAAEKAAAA